jgi:rare lipoprotein A
MPALAAAPAQANPNAAQTGMASYYGPKFHGKRTASGERFNQNAMTAAHRTAPFGSQIRVTNLASGKSVVVRVNDRGPFIRGRIVDVSTVAARQLGLVQRGVGRVRVQRL